ncbi:hypothetical protein D3C76_1039550 [compost metagenome]
MFPVAFYFIQILRLPRQTIQRLLDHRQFILNSFFARIEEFLLQAPDFCQTFIGRKSRR